MLLVVDNGSIYTKNLTTFLSDKKTEFTIQKFDEINLSNISEFNSFILSGRIKNNRITNAINSKIIKHAISEKKSLLGICYGAEILALTLGGTIRKITSLQKGNETINVLKNNLISNDPLDVFESHRFEISKLPNTLVPLAESKHCKYEIIQYEKNPIFGTQFHPEMSQDGHDLIEKFCSL